MHQVLAFALQTGSFTPPQNKQKQSRVQTKLKVDNRRGLCHRQQWAIEGTEESKDTPKRYSVLCLTWFWSSSKEKMPSDCQVTAKQLLTCCRIYSSAVSPIRSLTPLNIGTCGKEIKRLWWHISQRPPENIQITKVDAHTNWQQSDDERLRWLGKYNDIVDQKAKNVLQHTYSDLLAFCVRQHEKWSDTKKVVTDFHTFWINACQRSFNSSGKEETGYKAGPPDFSIFSAIPTSTLTRVLYERPFWKPPLVLCKHVLKKIWSIMARGHETRHVHLGIHKKWDMHPFVRVNACHSRVSLFHPLQMCRWTGVH